MNGPFFWTPENLMGRWQPGIGDPSFMGWFTVFSYFACAMVAFRAARRNAGAGSLPFFWRGVCVLMIALGINKQLDLQSLFTEIGRQVARHQGWMEDRRVVQFWFIVSLGTIAVGSFLWVVFFLRDSFKQFRLAFTGIFLLLLFVMIRAVSFHHVDAFLGLRFLDMKMNWIIELGGIYTILVAGVMAPLRSNKDRGQGDRDSCSPINRVLGCNDRCRQNAALSRSSSQPPDRNIDIECRPGVVNVPESVVVVFKIT
jgi:hypothetical protein